MGQLEVYTLQDIYILSIIAGVLSTYFAEEIEATIESIAAYAYSANNTISKKRQKLDCYHVPAGDIIGAMSLTFKFIPLTATTFISVEKTVDEKVIWQDEFLAK